MARGTDKTKVAGAKRATKPKARTTRAPRKRKPATAATSATNVSPHVEILDVGVHDPHVRAKAEIQAFNDFFTILAERANAHGLEPTKIVKVDNEYMICFLKSDGSYGNCRPYTNPV